MVILKPKFEILFPKTRDTIDDMLELVEQAARTCYKSEKSIKCRFDEEYIRSKIDAGHESVIEHSMVTVKLTCDRGVTHEIVRHRIASYSQESTRYCNYSKDKFGNEISVIDVKTGIMLDPKMKEISPAPIIEEWIEAMKDAERHYMRMIELGASPQIARSVLPNSTKTEIIISMNFREWRHFFKLRTAITAHPQMREITIPMLRHFKAVFHPIFDDIPIDPDSLV